MSVTPVATPGGIAEVGREQEKPLSDMSTGKVKRRRLHLGGTVGEGVRPTRISGAWAAIFVAVLLGAALIDFIVENTHSVRINFFAAHGYIPVAVALLAAALAGAFVVLAVGVCRTTQLRMVLRRRARRAKTHVAAGVNGDGKDWESA